MSIFTSPLGIKSGIYGLSLYAFGVICVRQFRNTWFSEQGAGLGLNPSQAQLALLAIGPPQGWLTIKGFEWLGICPKHQIPVGLLVAYVYAGLLDGLSFLYPPYPYGLKGDKANTRAVSFLIWCNAWIAAFAVLSQQ